ncbi:hypothetical protein PI124_g8831 [Phytophthora idaei]|nr:hypothetical protein PI125_g8622 [Phytophthora idaei]KAG3158171.1 hypothetical protein PI126_g7979 [Phytophthora idaei]KAG3246462.1 hypothetical protein PI124_g8831 [Phytophthora idaei]
MKVRVVAQSSSPPVLQAYFDATTTPSDSRLITVSLYVAGALRPLRALLDSTNNFFRASCLSVLPPTIAARESRGEVAVKLADGKFCQVLVRDRTETTADAVLTLLDGVYLLGDPTLSSRVYIHHGY